MYLRPSQGHLIVEPIKESSDTIIIPETHLKELQSQFRVVSVGKGRIKRLKNGTFLRLMTEVRPGDRIVANTYAGREVPIDGKVMRLIEQDSVMAIIDNDSQPAVA